LDECAGNLWRQLDGQAPHLVIAFVSPHHDRVDESAAAAISERFPDAVVVGCMGAGIIGAGHEVENRPAVSLTAAVLPDVSISPFHISNTQLPSPDDAPDAWAELVATPLH